ncbi:MAG: hypothetical protein PHV30_01845 [Candidatus Margulisbacteria bacterium]|nr:hypothetical protein [Candidatus Margulisiibacteriota bacterium]
MQKKLVSIPSIGLKAADLECYSDQFLLAGFTLPETVANIDVRYFNDFLQMNLSEEFDDVAELLDAGTSNECPDNLWEHNIQLLKKMENNKPYYLRSSALGERGGTGIYVSMIFIPFGDMETDLYTLWEKQCEIYLSEFTPQAIAYRKKFNAPSGMAILIQPVVGKSNWEYFAPAYTISGYTSYNGCPLIRIGQGLADVVNKPAIVFTKKDEAISSCIDKGFDLATDWLLDLETGKVSDGKYERKMSEYQAIAEKLFYMLEKISGSYYFEAAIPEEGAAPALLQVAPYTEKKIEAWTINLAAAKLLWQGTDKLGYGIKEGRGIIVINNFFEESADELEQLNNQMSGHMVVVPQRALSTLPGSLGGVSLNFQHISNAGILVEMQYKSKIVIPADMKYYQPTIDHSDNRGGTHVQQLLGRSDILFLGVENPSLKLLKDMPKVKNSRNYFVIDVPWAMENPQGNEPGKIYITGDAKKMAFRPGYINKVLVEMMDIQFWLLQAREVYGADYLDTPLEKASLIMEEILQKIVATGTKELFNFDPYYIDTTHYDQKAVLQAIEVILDNTGMILGLSRMFQEHPRHEIDDYYFYKYLNKLKDHLIQI